MKQILLPMNIIEENPLLYRIYHGNLWLAVTVPIIVIIAWSNMSIMAKEKNRRFAWNVINLSLAFASVAVIVFTTILYRTTGKREVDLIPFDTFRLARIDPDYYRSMLMNVLLFVPFGLTVSTILPNKWKTIHRIAFTITVACFLSILIEAVQYWRSIGTAEVDDVIANTAGALLGASQLILAEKLWKKRK